MLSIAICDDEALHRQNTMNVLLRHAAAYDPALREFASPAALLAAMEEEHYAPEIAFLDIQMEESGIALAQTINRRCPSCAVIFLTSYLNFATEVYEAKHVYFILKEQLEERVDAALARALQQMRDEKVLVYRSGSSLGTIPAREILYLERVLRQTRIMTMKGEVWSKEEPAKLLQGAVGERFVRCHQSYWVNLEKIKVWNKTEFSLEDGTRIPISRTYRSEAQALFFKHLGRRF